MTPLVKDQHELVVSRIKPTVMAATTLKEIMSIIDDVGRTQARLVGVLQMFADDGFDHEFRRHVATRTLQRFIEEGNSLEEAIEKSLVRVPTTPDISIPMSSTSTILGEVEEGSSLSDVLKANGSLIQEQDFEPNQEVIVVDARIPSIEESTASEESALQGTTPHEKQISIIENHTPVLPAVGGIGSWLKKGFSALKSGVSAINPIFGAALHGVEALAKGLGNKRKEATPTHGAMPVPPSRDDMITHYTGPGESSDVAFNLPMTKPVQIGGLPGKFCPDYSQLPFKGGPGILPNDVMPPSLVRSIREIRKEKRAAGGVDPVTRLPFILPLDDKVEIVSSPLMKHHSLGLLELGMSIGIPRQAVTPFRTIVKSDDKVSGTTLEINFGDSDVGSDALPLGWTAPFIEISFSLSGINEVEDALYSFSLEIPQGQSLDGDLAAFIATGMYDSLKTGPIVIRVRNEKGTSSTGRLVIFPWRQDGGAVAYQPAYARAQAGDLDIGQGRMQLSVSVAPPKSHISLVVPGVGSELLRQIKSSIIYGLK